MTFFFPAGFRVTSDDGFPLAGGSLRYYAANTTTPKAVYSDAARTVSLGSVVAINSAGEPITGGNVQTMVYPGIGDYRVRLYDANDVLIWDQDNIPGAEEAAEESETAIAVTPVVSLTASGTHTIADRGKLFSVDPTGGPFSRTLPSAITAGDGFRLGFHHVGSANAATILAPGAQNIRGQRLGKSFALVGRGESIWIVSNGADWIVDSYSPPLRKATAPYFIVLDQLLSPPANPAAGARYLISDTPTGSWSTLGFSKNYIVEADGNGSWIAHVPEEGWLAFDQDEKTSLVFRDGAWENFQVDPGTSTLKTLIVQDQKASNTDGGTPTLDAWTEATLNTSVVNTIEDASLASNEITLPAGRYRVKARKVFAVTGESRIRFKTADSSDVIILSESVHSGNIISTNSANAVVGVTAMLDGEFEITESTDFVLEYYVNVNQYTTATQGLGIPSNISGSVEVYATVTIEDLAAQQGPKGDEGDPGVDGPPGALQYQFNTATSGDPGSGKVLINNANPVSATALHVSETDANAADLSALVSIFDDSTSAKKALFIATKVGAPDNVMVFRITGAGTDQGDYWAFPIEYVAHDGSLADNNDLAVVVIPVGDKGDTGNNGPTGSTSFDFDDTTSDGDPGSGNFRLNHATPASATEAYFDDENNGNESVAGWLDTFDDSGNSALRGYLHLFDAVDPTVVFHIYAVSGSVVDGTGYRKVTIAHVAGAGSFTPANEILAAFFARGPAGSGLADIVEDTTPQLGGNLDANGFNVGFDDNTGIRDDSGNEQLIFQKTASAVNQLEITNAATGDAPKLAAAGDDTNIDIDLAPKGTGKVRVGGSPVLKANGNETLTAGFAATSDDDGTKSSGTFTPTFLGGNFRRYINGGAHTLAPPSGEGTMIVQITNNGSAGAITTSGFSKVTGDTITTTNGHDFILNIQVINGFSHLHVTALQ